MSDTIKYNFYLSETENLVTVMTCNEVFNLERTNMFLKKCDVDY